MVIESHDFWEKSRLGLDLFEVQILFFEMAYLGRTGLTWTYRRPYRFIVNCLKILLLN